MRLKLFCIFIFWFAKSFGQERNLKYYIEKAAVNSPLLTDYGNQVKAVTIDSLLNRATFRPQITGSLNAAYAPVIKGYGYDTAISNGQVVSALVGVNQKIYGRSRINSQAASFRLLKESLALKKKIAEKDLTKAIISQYINAWGIAQQIHFNKKNTTLLDDEDAILKKLARNSIYKQTDYLIFNITVKQQELAALQLKQQFRNELAMLNYLSGETDTTLIALQKPDISIKLVVDSKQIFLQQFKTDSLKLVNDNKLIDANYKPSLSLLADAGYNSSFIYDAYKNFGFSVGAGLTVPIYDGRQRSLQYQKNAVALETLKVYKGNSLRQNAQQIYMLHLKLAQEDETAAALQSQLAISEALIEANRKLLLTGDAQITEYIIALGNLVNIQSGIAQNSVDRLQIINELNYWKINE